LKRSIPEGAARRRCRKIKARHPRHEETLERNA
jgi:hypothetical protein